MNVDLIYRNNSFNFDLRKDVSVKYLEDMASKLISKDKSSFDLLYNNNNLSEYNNSLLKDVTQNEGTIPIVISPKMNQNKTNTQKKLPKIKLKKHIRKISNDINEKNNNLILNKYNDNELCHSQSDNSSKNVLKYNLSISNQKKKEKERKNRLKNEVFEEIYDKKESELLILMKNLSQKIKDYDDLLYQKYKSDSKNRELLLFEKNIIDFKNRQLQYIKKLITYFEEKFELNEFIRELKNCNIKDGFRRNKKVEQSKIHSITTVNDTENQNKNNELPLINYNENKPIKMLYLSQNKRDKSIRNEIEKDQIIDKPALKSEKKISKNLLARNMNDNLYQNIEVQDTKIYKTIDEKKPQKNKTYLKNRSIGTTKDNTNQSDSSTFSKMQEKQNYILNLKSPKNENENNINKNISDNNEINEENIKNTMKEQNKRNSNNDKDSDNDNKININTNINNDNMDKGDINDDKINHNIYPSNRKRRLSIESINYDNKKLSCLLEDINESNNVDSNSDSSFSDSNLESKSSNSNNNSNSDSNSKSKEKVKIQKSEKTVKSLGKKKKKRMDYSNIKNAKIGYMVKSKERKVKQRVKKLGANEYDFLI